MKKVILLLGSLVFVSILQAQTFNLVVNGGFGSGTYNMGDTVFIWSELPFGTNVFEKWTGNANSFMLESNEWLTRLVVPVGSGILQIEANASIVNSGAVPMEEGIPLPADSSGIVYVTQKAVNYAIPANPVGLIFCFHGTDGSGEKWASDFEKMSFVKSATLRHYIVVATDANERTLGDQNGDGKIKWLRVDPETDNVSTNIDIAAISALRDTIFNRLNLPLGFPVFAVGTSNGANFADLCAAALNFNASAHVTGNGLPDVYALRPDATPVIFVQSENDNQENANPAIALSNYQALVNRGISTEFHWHRKTPVYSQRFVRSAQMLVSLQQSDSIFQRMLMVPGLLDLENKMTIDELSELPSNLYNGLGLSTAAQGNCNTQMKVLNADHKFHSHFNNRIIDFFETVLATVNIQSHSPNTPINMAFPNPTSGIITLKGLDENAAVTLYSASGAKLRLFSNTNHLNLTGYPPAMYLIKIEKELESNIIRVIKK